MAGFRVLAVLLGLICLTVAVASYFYDYPPVNQVTAYFLEDANLWDFVKSTTPRDMVIKDYLKYIIRGYSVLALGMGLLFLISAFNPLRMRPYITVVIIGALVWLGLAIYMGITLKIPTLWWIGDSAICLILAILLITFFPKKVKVEKQVDEGKWEE